MMTKIISVLAIVAFLVIVSTSFFHKYEYSVFEGSCGDYNGHYECHYSWTDKIILDNGTIVRYSDIVSWQDFLYQNGRFIPLGTGFWDIPIGYGKWMIGEKNSIHYIVMRSDICDFYCNFFKNEGQV